MNDLLAKLHDLQLSSSQIDQTFLIIDKWLEEKYPVLSQMYRKEILKKALDANQVKR